MLRFAPERGVRAHMDFRSLRRAVVQITTAFILLIAAFLAYAEFATNNEELRLKHFARPFPSVQMQEQPRKKLPVPTQNHGCVFPAQSIWALASTAHSWTAGFAMLPFLTERLSIVKFSSSTRLGSNHRFSAPRRLRRRADPQVKR